MANGPILHVFSYFSAIIGEIKINGENFLKKVKIPDQNPYAMCFHAAIIATCNGCGQVFDLSCSQLLRLSKWLLGFGY